MKSAILLACTACLFGLMSCSKKKQDKPDNPDGPKSTAGQVLDAAQRAADIANDNVRRINEAAESEE